MKLKTKIQKQHNSAGVLIPASKRKAMNIGIGADVTLNVTDDGLLIASIKKRYTLDPNAVRLQQMRDTLTLFF